MLHYLSTRLGRSGVLLAASLLGALVFTSSPALAAGKYVYNTKFEAAFNAALAESSSTSFEPYGGVAVDNSSGSSAGDIYAANEGGVVDKFEVTGSGKTVKVKFLCELGGSNMQPSAKPCAGTQAPEELPYVQGVAVGPSGEVFVGNSSYERVDEFNSTGDFVRVLTGWSADASTGTSAGTLRSVDKLAVEPANGDLFVGEYNEDLEGEAIDKLKLNGTSTPELVQQLTASDIPAGDSPYWVSSLAVDGNGDLYVADVSDFDVFRFLPGASANEGDTFDAAATIAYPKPEYNEAEEKYEAGGCNPEEELCEPPGVLAADPTTSALFVTHSPGIEWYGYDSSSTPVGKLTLTENFLSTYPKRPEYPFGIAASASGTVYVADAGPETIDDFELNLLGGPPAVSTCKPSSETASGVTLEGSVTPPEGNATTYKFEYGARTVTGEVGNSGEAPLVETEVIQLTPATTYHYWVIEARTGAHGEEKTLTTGPEATTAKLTGTLTHLPSGYSTGYYFEYGTGPLPYGQSTTEASAGASTSAQPVSAALTGLTPETIYDCRIVANAVGGEAEGVNQEFETKPAVAGVTTSSASNVTSEDAMLTGALKPEGVPAEYFYEYGTTSAYGHSTIAKTSSSNAEVRAPETLLGLQPLTIYHYRIVARRVIEGKTYATHGEDEVFNTSGTGPEVRAENASNIGSFSATLEATLNPANSATTYYFLYGTSAAGEQAFVPAGAVAGDGSIQASPETIQNLKPDTTYYYHVVVENAFGKVEGPGGAEEKSFRTLPADPPEVALAPLGEVTQTTATLSVMLNPQGLPTIYDIDLTINGVNVLVAAQSAGEGAVPQTSTYVLSGLVAGTTYQVHVLARNEAGEDESAVQGFTTTPSSTFEVSQPMTPAILATPIFTPETAIIPTIKPKSSTTAQKLSKALKACEKKVKQKRVTCEKRARKKYAPVAKKKAKAKKKVRHERGKSHGSKK